MTGQLSDWIKQPEGALALLALLPVVFVWLLSWIPSRHHTGRRVREGNPLRGRWHEEEDAQTGTRTLAYLCRTLPLAELRELAAGLRHLPVQLVAPVLRHLMRSPDPELALYSQSMLQQNREKLQHLASTLLTRPDYDDPRVIAAELETSLTLASSGLVTQNERRGALMHMANRIREKFSKTEVTPRLALVGAEIFLEAGLPRLALPLLEKLDVTGVHRVDLEKRLRFSMENRNQTPA